MSNAADKIVTAIVAKMEEQFEKQEQYMVTQFVEITASINALSARLSDIEKTLATPRKAPAAAKLPKREAAASATDAPARATDAPTPTQPTPTNVMAYFKEMYKDEGFRAEFLTAERVAELEAHTATMSLEKREKAAVKFVYDSIKSSKSDLALLRSKFAEFKKNGGAAKQTPQLEAEPHTPA